MTALTLGHRRENLPAEVTRFIGRKRELAAVTSAIARHRLVTLRGAGGVGKTRLALRAATAEKASFAEGCWLVELSALRDPSLLPRTVSATLGLPDETSGDPLATLAEQLADRELLLVLDTCEHLVEACAKLTRALLEAAPGLRVLATSREPLGVPDEDVLLIPPLRVAAHPGEAAESEAVALFVDRAQAAMEGFRLTPENTGAVTKLVRKLDGIPLALELAAVRLRSMPIEDILTRLDDRFRILGTTRTNTDRHRTLRSAVRWSYELCTATEQRLWADLTVFPGGFDLAAAEAICGPAAVDDLPRLAEKSIVQYDEGAGRYRMLDTMREFGAERLAGRPDADQIRQRHRDYYLSVVERAAAQTLSPRQVHWLTRLREETDNLRAALDWSFAVAGQQAAGRRMTVGLRTYWLMTGAFSEGRDWHEKARRVAPGPAEHAWAVYGAAILAVQQGDLPAAGPLLDEAAGLAAALGDEDLAAHVSDAQGSAAFYLGDLETARTRHEAALARYERGGFSNAFALSSYARLASVCLLLLDIDRAIGLCEEYLRRCQETGEQWGRGTALWTRGAGRWLSKDLTGAVDDALACLEIKEELGDLHTITMSFDLLAVCYAGLGDHERAAALYGAGDTYWKLIGAPIQMGPGYSNLRRGAADTALASLGEETYNAAYASGAGLSLADAIAVARRRRPATPEPSEPAKPLTRREREIAGLVAEGLGNREIAERLFLSKRTVDSHLEHIFTKLAITSRTQLATWVLDQR
ncbi:MAG: LuxR family transcriptional regulator [Nocardiopsaceae bacterium]|nr:LuxR family transcriptional regulator [Nocardiopsaceae bacterium]